MSNIVIKLSNITKSYNTSNGKIDILKGIDYSFEKGKLYAIRGHSGSGKTTLVRILGLLDNYDSGEYLLYGNSTSNLTDTKSSEYRMKYIGFVFQDYNLLPYLKAYENVMIPMIVNKEITKYSRDKKIKELFASVDLTERMNHFPNELSGGEQQRVAIARALANDPDIIIADEPTGNLNKASEKIIFTLLKKLTKQDKCIIVVSHSDEVFAYADKIINLENGKLEEVENDN